VAHFSLTHDHLVLVVDDQVDIRVALQDLLEIHGFFVRTAANGRVALEMLKAGPLPCVMVLDLMMPVMNGQQLSAALRSDPDERLRGLPIIVMTAGDASEAPKDAIRVMCKPLRSSELLATIHEHC
jgi:CheY-like chemotaxis protein